jgi:uncharacterized protein YdeI (YjbR/CyaY-like superfamily)
VTSTPELLNNLPVMLFKHQQDWTRWLDKNHAKSAGVWMQIAKNTGDLKSVSYADALEIALCYGWIDGQKKSRDEASWLQKFTPRGPRSSWSKINKAKAEKLIKSGRMQPAGLAAIERAKKAGQWEAAYDSHSTAMVPDDFQAALNQNPKAKAFFATLDSNNRYAMLFRLQTAKRPETRARRIEQFIGLLEKHEKIYR